MGILSAMYKVVPKWLKVVADVIVKKVTGNHHKARFFAVPGISEYTIGYLTDRGYRVQVTAKPIVDGRISKKYKGVDLIQMLQRGPIPYECYREIMEALAASPYVFGMAPQYIMPNHNAPIPHNGEVTLYLTDTDEKASYMIVVGDNRLANEALRKRALEGRDHVHGLYDYPQ